MADPNARSFDDPVIGGVHDLGDVGVGDHLIRQISSDAGDHTTHD
jgi:hypothetical protein